MSGTETRCNFMLITIHIIFSFSGMGNDWEWLFLYLHIFFKNQYRSKNQSILSHWCGIIYTTTRITSGIPILIIWPVWAVDNSPIIKSKLPPHANRAESEAPTVNYSLMIHVTFIRGRDQRRRLVTDVFTSGDVRVARLSTDVSFIDMWNCWMICRRRTISSLYLYMQQQQQDAVRERRLRPRYRHVANSTEKRCQTSDWLDNPCVCYMI